MSDVAADAAKEDGADTWQPLTHQASIARASVRLRLVKMFPQTAKSWEKNEELPRARADQWLSDQIGKFEEKERGSRSNVPGMIAIARLWGNSYGVKYGDKPRPDQADLALAYVDYVFSPVIGAAASAVQAEMDTIVQGVGPGATALEQLNKFREHYEGLIEALRICEPDDADAWAMITQYDQWVSYLVELVNGGSGNKRLLRPTDNLQILVERSLESAASLEEATKRKSGSPIVDLHNFFTLSNKLQSLCSNVALLQKEKRSKDEAEATSELVKHSETYFKKLDRILEIVEDRRVDEAFHGLVVAVTLGLQDKMLIYGGKTVLGMKRVLRVRYGRDPDWRHPVLLMTANLFQGDPVPVELSQLKAYFEDGHHAAVLAAASELDVADFQPQIAAALEAVGRKLRRSQ